MRIVEQKTLRMIHVPGCSCKKIYPKFKIVHHAGLIHLVLTTPSFIYSWVVLS